MAKRDEQGSRVLDYGDYKPAGKDFQPPAEMDDLTDTLQVGIEQIKKNSGRPAVYPCTEQGLEDFAKASAAYLQHLNTVNSRKGEGEQRLIPDYEGWCIFCGISRRTMLTYEKTRPQEWQDVIEFFKTVILAGRKQLASCFKIPPVLEAMNLTNNFQYLNTSEFKITAQSATPEQEKAAILESKLDESGLVWDDERQEYVPAGEKGGEL